MILRRRRQKDRSCSNTGEQFALTPGLTLLSATGSRRDAPAPQVLQQGVQLRHRAEQVLPRCTLLACAVPRHPPAALRKAQQLMRSARLRCRRQQQRVALQPGGACLRRPLAAIACGLLRKAARKQQHRVSCGRRAACLSRCTPCASGGFELGAQSRQPLRRRARQGRCGPCMRASLGPAIPRLQSAAAVRSQRPAFKSSGNLHAASKHRFMQSGVM